MPVTYNIIFDITSGPGPVSGQITFEEVGANNASVTSFNITDPLGSVFDEGDSIPATAAFDGGGAVNGVDLSGDDDNAPGASSSSISMDGALNFQIDGLDTSIIGTYTLQVVPEPGTALLLAVGLGGLGAARRRR